MFLILQKNWGSYSWGLLLNFSSIFFKFKDNFVLNCQRECLSLSIRCFFQNLKLVFNNKMYFLFWPHFNKTDQLISFQTSSSSRRSQPRAWRRRRRSWRWWRSTRRSWRACGRGSRKNGTSFRRASAVQSKKLSKTKEGQYQTLLLLLSLTLLSLMLLLSLKLSWLMLLHLLFCCCWSDAG